MREICLDTETTGLDPRYGHRVVEIGCVEMVNKIKTGRFFHCYLNPEMDMPEEAFRIHGLSSKFLAKKPLFKDIAAEFVEFIGQDSVLVIHNAAFDLKFLNYELNSLRKEDFSKFQFIDTVQMARRKYPGAPASLDALCKRFNIDLSRRVRDGHGALLDAELLAEVYIELCGGSQSSIMFTVSDMNKGSKRKAKARRSARNFDYSEAERTAHMAFLGKIKNPVWSN